ncbi:hypothetical protein CBER1_04425 [Cercospora berteroae]|uniref:F-box domain-containing protein n=1 Tax=Cercospora berteroae TaxID=357750 RepID=A0A2S6CGM4_9PEZI|nr:hypothetical protein CBER1_04425 [Cercospora berteroae]
MQEPGARVAGIYELLEMIIVDLPLKDLVQLRAVGQHFKKVVDTSEQIALRFCLPFSRQLRAVDYARHPLLPKEVDIWAGRRPLGGYVVCRFVLRAAGRFDWTAAASWKSFYACRPETRSMRAWSGCSKVFGSGSMGEYRYYRSQRGITLSQLADAACAMRLDAGVDEAIVHFETDLDFEGNDVASEASSTYAEYWL